MTENFNNPDSSPKTPASEAHESVRNINQSLAEQGAEGALRAFNLEINNYTNVHGLNTSETQAYWKAMSDEMEGTGVIPRIDLIDVVAAEWLKENKSWGNYSAENVDELRKNLPASAANNYLADHLMQPDNFTQFKNASDDMPLLGESRIAGADLDATIGNYRYATALSANSNQLFNAVSQNGRITPESLAAYQQRYNELGPAAGGAFNEANAHLINEMRSDWDWNNYSVKKMTTSDDWFGLNTFMTQQSIDSVVRVMPEVVGDDASVPYTSNEDPLQAHASEAYDNVRKFAPPVVDGWVDSTENFFTGLSKDPLVQAINELPGTVKESLRSSLPESWMNVIDAALPDTLSQPIDDTVFPSPDERAIQQMFPLVPLAAPLVKSAVATSAAVVEEVEAHLPDSMNGASGDAAAADQLAAQQAAPEQAAAEQAAADKAAADKAAADKVAADKAAADKAAADKAAADKAAADKAAADQAAEAEALSKQREAAYMESVATLVTPTAGEGYSQVASRMLGIPLGSDFVADVSTDPTEAKAQWDAIFKLSDSLAALNGNKIDWNSNTWGDPIPQDLGSFITEENLAILERDNPGISKTLDALTDQAILDHKVYIPYVTQAQD